MSVPIKQTKLKKLKVHFEDLFIRFILLTALINQSGKKVTLTVNKFTVNTVTK